MPIGTVDDWATMATRLAAVPRALAGYADSLRYAAACGQVSARRQVLACIEQCRETSEYFRALADRAPSTLPAGANADPPSGRGRGGPRLR